MYLPALSDRELLAHFHATCDPLTTTDLEAEIARRFEARVELDAFHDAMDAIADECGIETAQQAQDFRELLSDHYIHDISTLRTKLERADTFYDIATDAGDIVFRLNTLINATR